MSGTNLKSLSFDPQVIDRLVKWAEKLNPIRAMLLYSSRANPNASVDIFSDYDVLLAVTDIHPFHEDDRWLEEFGKVMVVFRNPIDLEHGFECFGFITHYLDGTKIDYGFFPVEYLRWAASQSRLPDDLDNGYMVLLDKDRLTETLKPPTYAAYLPSPPTAREFRAVCEEFFNDAAYVAKNLWREDLFGVKLSLDHIMKFQCLRKMLEWNMGIKGHWLVKPGANGKGLKKYISPEIWSELESTYVGGGVEENWEGLIKTINLFRKVAVEVAGDLGFTYPYDQDRRIMHYLARVKSLDPRAKTFPRDQ